MSKDNTHKKIGSKEETKTPSGNPVIDVMIGAIGAFLYKKPHANIQAVNGLLGRVPFFYNVLEGYFGEKSTFTKILNKLPEKSKYNGITNALHNISSSIEIIKDESIGTIYGLLKANNDAIEKLSAANSESSASEIILDIKNIDNLNNFLKNLNKVNINKKLISLNKLFDVFSKTDDLGDPKKLVNSTNSLIESITAISNINLDEKRVDYIKSNIKDLNDIVKTELKDLVNQIIKFNTKYKLDKDANVTFNNLAVVIKGISKALDTTPKTKYLLNAIIKIPLLITTIKKLAILIDKVGKLEKPVVKGFGVFETISKDVKKVVGNLASIDPKDLKKSINIVKGFIKVILISSAILLLGGLAMMIINPGLVILFAATLFGFVAGMFITLKFLLKNKKNLAEGAILLYTVSKLVLISGLILILGGMMMNIINVSSLLIFTGTLFVFITLMSLILFSITKFIKPAAFKTIYALSTIVLVTGSILIFAALIGKSLDVKSLFLFSAILLGFIVALGFIYNKIAAKFIGKAITISKDFIILVGISGLILVLGSLVSKLIDPLGLLAFTGYLAIFIAANILVYMTLAAPVKVSLNISDSFMKLIGVSALVMILGSLAMYIINPLNLVMFTSLLGLFIMLTLQPIIGAAGMVAPAGNIIGDFGKTVAICALTMILGSLAMHIIDPVLTLEFTGLLTFFMWGVLSPFIAFGKRIGKSLKYAKQLAILVLITGGVMIVGSILFMIFPDLKKHALAFVLLMDLLMGGITALCWGLSKMGTKIQKGILYMGAIVVLCGLMAGVVFILSSAVSGVSMGELWNGVGIMFTMILGIGGLALGLGAILSNPLALIAMGLGTEFMAVMAGILMMIGDAMKNIATALLICTITGKSLDFKLISDMILNSVTLADSLSKFLPYADIMDSVCNAAEAMSRALSSIAQSVADYANLTVPIYEGTKIVGYRQLSESDFKSAAENVSTIITVLGGAIIKTYESNPEMFEIKGAFADLGIGKSKFDMVAKSLKVLGPLISSIAEGVKDYSELKMPIYGKGGKIESYKMLSNSDFKNAAKNISKVITVLSKAIISTYESNPDMFEIKGTFADLGFGKSKFDMVAKSLKVLGPLISSISDGIKDYSELKMPIYNKKGEITGYTPLENKHFKDAANNISIVITTLARAIIDTYESNPEMFADTGVFGFGDSVFDTVTNSVSKLGSLISDIAEGIKFYTELKIPEYGKEGKIESYKTLTEDDFTNAATNIGTIITTLSRAIIDVYNLNPKLFDDEEDSIFNTVMNSVSHLGGLVSNIAEGIVIYSSAQIPDQWDKNGKPIHFIPINAETKAAAGQSIAEIITFIARELTTIYTERASDEVTKAMFDDGDESIFATILKSCSSIGDIVAGVAEGIVLFSAGQVPNKWDEKTGKPIGFQRLTYDEMEEAGEKIGAIITTIAQAFVNVYDKNKDDLFDEGKDSPLYVIINACSKMGNIVSSIADEVIKFASFQIPDQWNSEGVAIHYIKLTGTEIDSAKTNIENCITWLITAINNIWNDENYKKAFIGGNNSPANIIIKSLTNISGSITKIIASIIAYANFRLPKKYDKDGNIIEYYNNADKDTVLKQSAETISFILTTLGKTVSTIYNENPNLYSGKFAPIKNVLSSCINIGVAISSVANALALYANDAVPKFEKDKTDPTGKTSNISKLAESASKTIRVIMSTVGLSLLKLYDDYPSLFENTEFEMFGGLISFKSSSKNKIAVVTKTINAIMTGIYNTAKALKEFDTNDYTTALKNVNDIFNSLINTFTFNKDANKILILDEIIKNASKFSDSFDNITTAITDIIGSITENSKSYSSFNKLWETYKLEINESIKNVRSMFSDVVNGVLKSPDGAKFMGKKTIDAMTSQGAFASSAISVINNIILKCNTINEAVGSIDVTNLKTDINSKIATITNAILMLTTIVENLNSNLKYIDFEDFNKNIDSIVTDIKNIIIISNNINTLNDILTNIKLSAFIGGEKSKFNKVTNIIKNILTKIADIYDWFDADKPDEISKQIISVKSIAECLSEINDIYNNIEKNNKLNKFNDDLFWFNYYFSHFVSNETLNKIDKEQKSINGFITTVNSINTSKVTQLIRLTNAMNKLSSGAKDLDKFADKLTNDFGGVVDKLSNEIADAKKTIIEINKKEEQRKKQIDEYIKNIKNIMAEKLIVEISQNTDDTDSPDNSNGGNPGDPKEDNLTVPPTKPSTGTTPKPAQTTVAAGNGQGNGNKNSGLNIEELAAKLSNKFAAKLSDAKIKPNANKTFYQIKF